LARYGGQPAYWADDVRRLAAALRGALPDERYGVPHDLGEAFGEAAAPGVFQQLVYRFGQLLQVWPALVEVARELRLRGARPAVGVCGAGPVPARRPVRQKVVNCPDRRDSQWPIRDCSPSSPPSRPATTARAGAPPASVTRR